MTDAKRILIAEDDEDISWGISKSLTMIRPNLHVRCVNNGTAALQLLRDETFDLVISDVQMPGCDGLSLTLEIRKSCPATKVILITAYGSDEVRKLVVDQEGCSYLEKPFDLSQLRQVVLQSLEITPAALNASFHGLGAETS
ncbi:MAG TPA: response regulator [bacterium]